jgi:hypothetical protein
MVTLITSNALEVGWILARSATNQQIRKPLLTPDEVKNIANNEGIAILVMGHHLGKKIYFIIKIIDLKNA